MTPLSSIRAVTFDATGTLFHVPRLAELYAEVMSRHGLRVRRRDLAGLIPRVWQEMACAVELGEDRFTTHPEGPRGWWRRFLERLCEHLEVPPPSPFAAAELFARFGRGDAYRLFPEVPAVLAELRRLGFGLAVISNWDPRLHGVLDDLGLAPLLDAVVTSSGVGVEKPHPAIFEEALEALGVEAHEALHVGDRVREDVEGALGVGMEALLLVRPDTPEGRKVAAASGGGGDLDSLEPLPRRLASTRPGAPRGPGVYGGPAAGGDLLE